MKDCVYVYIGCISVCLAAIMVIQSPFSLKEGEGRHSSGCESFPLASEDLEVLFTHAHSQSPTQLL